jgi:hypothetical protein
MTLQEMITKRQGETPKSENEWFEKRKAALAEKRAEWQARLDAMSAPPQGVSPDVVYMLELRKAVQMFLSTLDVDTQQEDMLSVASVFPEYQVGKKYKAKDVFRHGKNGVGDPQLYQVLQEHTSAAEWMPDTTPSLYKKVGVTEDGYPEWVQPLGASDAYNTGDMVSYNGKLYRSLMDANVYSPDAYLAGWEVVE